MGRTILVIDDEPNILGQIADRLSANQYDVLEATDGQEAVACAIEARPDLILLDVEMPKHGGMDVLQQLKMHALTRRIPVIALMVKVGADSVVTVHDRHAVAQLMKPVDPQQLLDIVERHLP